MLDRPPRSEERPYTPYGSAVDLWFDERPEVLVSGPAGTGKSRANLEKMHFCAEHYPGMRGLILRKTRESLVESALVTWEQHVVPADHPCLRGPARANRRVYRYPNGSEIIVGGLRASGKDMTQKVMSTEYDQIYIQEAIELTAEEWEKCTTRLRNGKMPVQQLIADTNPDAPTHWLKKRCNAGQTAILESRHEENPVLWDRAAGAWTEKGAKYIAKLDALTGNRKQRLRFGRWVQAEGVVYTEWDRKLHLIEMPKGIRTDWTRFMSIDFGYTNPFVAQWWARDFDGRLYCYRQIYMTGRIVAEHAKRIRELNARDWPTGHPRPPQAVVCDHDAEDMATLRKELPGWHIVPAKKSVDRGIEAVKARLKPAGDGKPRLFFVAGNLDQRDMELEDQKRPICTEEEFDSYVWDRKTAKGGGQLEKDEPLKENDHGCDALRYVVAELDFRDTKGTVPRTTPYINTPNIALPGGSTAGMQNWIKGRRR
jgi:phage terminase large subunit